MSHGSLSRRFTAFRTRLACLSRIARQIVASTSCAQKLDKSRCRNLRHGALNSHLRKSHPLQSFQHGSPRLSVAGLGLPFASVQQILSPLGSR